MRRSIVFSALVLVAVLALFVSRAGAQTAETVSASGSGDSGAIGSYLGNTKKDAQSFVFSGGGYVSQISLQLGTNSGSPTGDIVWSIQTDSSGSPSGTALISGSFTPSASSTNTVNITPSQSISGGVTYWLVFESVDSLTGSNFYMPIWAYPSAYSGGHAAEFTTGLGWTNYTNSDLVFSLSVVATSAGTSTGTASPFPAPTLPPDTATPIPAPSVTPTRPCAGMEIANADLGNNNYYYATGDIPHSIGTATTWVCFGQPYHMVAGQGLTIDGSYNYGISLVWGPRYCADFALTETGVTNSNYGYVYNGDFHVHGYSLWLCNGATFSDGSNFILSDSSYLTSGYYADEQLYFQASSTPFSIDITWYPAGSPTATPFPTATFVPTVTATAVPISNVIGWDTAPYCTPVSWGTFTPSPAPWDSNYVTSTPIYPGVFTATPFGAITATPWPTTVSNGLSPSYCVAGQVTNNTSSNLDLVSGGYASEPGMLAGCVYRVGSLYASSWWGPFGILPDYWHDMIVHDTGYVDLSFASFGQWAFRLQPNAVLHWSPLAGSVPTATYAPYQTPAGFGGQGGGLTPIPSSGAPISTAPVFNATRTPVPCVAAPTWNGNGTGDPPFTLNLDGPGTAQCFRVWPEISFHVAAITIGSVTVFGGADWDSDGVDFCLLPYSIQFKILDIDMSVYLQAILAIGLVSWASTTLRQSS